jgi:cardiolipin synthase (CMP-forming)
MLNLPNFLTLIRILSIPFFLVYLAYHRYSEAFIVFVLGGVTDFLDGLTARLMHQQTAIGAYLDPAADKLLVITSFTMLGLIDGVPMWLAVVVVSRDILLISGYAITYFLVQERLPAAPSRIGKASTMFQLVTLGSALALLAKPDFMPEWVMTVLVALTAATTVASGVQYIYRGLVWLQNKASSITRLG